MTLWQRYLGTLTGYSDQMITACPYFTGPTAFRWSPATNEIARHCWDVFTCQWPLVVMSALFGRAR